MTTPKFPARGADGSFCVLVGLHVSSGQAADTALRAQEWMNSVWMPNHETWTREWKTGTDLSETKVQTLRYADEFSATPHISFGGNSELRIRMLGRKGAKLWKDWLVSKIAPDLRLEFPEIGELLYIRNCD